MLVFPDFNRRFILETDASGMGLGAVLAQEQSDGSVCPIAYTSCSLQKHERSYGITELEGLGVVWAVKHFRPYLYGHSCAVYTDHEALKSLLNTPQPSGKLTQWGMALQELDLHIQHRSGSASSRFPQTLKSNGDLGTPSGVIASISSTENDIPALQRQDEELITYLETGLLPDEDKFAKRLALTQSRYEVEDHVLYRVANDFTLREVPPTSMRKRLFEEAHSERFGAHLSYSKVHGQLYKHYWWNGMQSDVS